MQFPMVCTNLKKWLCIHNNCKSDCLNHPLVFHMFYNWSYTVLYLSCSKKKKKKIDFLISTLVQGFKVLCFTDIFRNISFCYQLQIIFMFHTWAERKKNKSSFSIFVIILFLLEWNIERKNFKPCNKLLCCFDFFCFAVICIRDSLIFILSHSDSMRQQCTT